MAITIDLCVGELSRPGLLGSAEEARCPVGKHTGEIGPIFYLLWSARHLLFEGYGRLCTESDLSWSFVWCQEGRIMPLTFKDLTAKKSVRMFGCKIYYQTISSECFSSCEVCFFQGAFISISTSQMS